MLGLAMAAVLWMSQQPDPDGLSRESRTAIRLVVEALETEKARQAALDPPTSDRERLERMGVLDQIGRRALNSVDYSRLPTDERPAARAAVWRVLGDNDRALMGELLAMVPPEGWFLKSVYGEQAAASAFLIVQHSGPEHWRRFLPVLEPLVAKGEVDGEEYGLMYDRLAVSEGRPQRYGTQMVCRDGRWAVDTLEDPEKVDVRRQEMGFRWTMAEYEARFTASSCA